mmetsp:Transcript_16199/g.50464  ORF Transcript_16199/g.50464 Transcript_16199/m.50464 type:complete len:307 (+) Transcript_16199:178-1098(+)
MISSTSKSCSVITALESSICRFTRQLSHTPISAGSIGSPELMSTPTVLPSDVASCSLISVSFASYPAFSASVRGMTSSASAYACTPSFARPRTDFLNSRRCACARSSKAPAPGTIWPSSTALRTARRPSRTASFIWSIVCLCGPLRRMVHESGWRVPSTNVNASSPSCCSYTLSAQPSTSGVISSNELTAVPPHASVSRSMLRRLARRSARMPAFCKASSASGSIPFWLTRTKSWPAVHTAFCTLRMSCTRSSTHLRSAASIFSRCSALEYMKAELTSDFSYSSVALHVSTKQLESAFFMSGWRPP